MLSQEETLALLKIAKQGDDVAKERLIIENSSLIKCIVKRFLGRGVEYDDLYQLGEMGFIKAVNNFDESFNVKFSTYAVPMIMGEIKRFLRDDGSIKVSRIIKGLNIKIKQYLEQARTEGRPEPSINELSDYFHVSKDEIVLAIGSSNRPVSLYESVNDDGGKAIELIDKIPSGYEEEDFLEVLMLKRLVEDLSLREQKIITMRYFYDKTQSEVASVLGVSQVQVSRLETKIVDKLKSKI